MRDVLAVGSAPSRGALERVPTLTVESASAVAGGVANAVAVAPTASSLLWAPSGEVEVREGGAEDVGLDPGQRGEPGRSWCGETGKGGLVDAAGDVAG